HALVRHVVRERHAKLRVGLAEVTDGRAARDAAARRDAPTASHAAPRYRIGPDDLRDRLAPLNEDLSEREAEPGIGGSERARHRGIRERRDGADVGHGQLRYAVLERRER